MSRSPDCDCPSLGGCCPRRAALVRDPDLNRDIVTLKFIKNLRIDGGRVSFTIELDHARVPLKDQMREQARARSAAIPGVTAVEVEMTAQVRSTTAADQPARPRCPA